MSNYSDFWDTRKSTLVDDILSDTEVKTKPKKDHMALAGHKRAIGNFVRIVSGQNIPVKFADRGDSYTDGKKVVISSTINERTFDETVGLALHEGSHIAFSDFNIFAEVRNWHEIGGFELTPERMTFLRNMINYIEDRRVDSIVFKSSPGYKGYYHSMYAKYFNHKTITKGLNSNMYREIDLDSYMFRIVNFTNEGTDLDALPRLKEIYRMINMGNISRLKNTEDVIEVASEVCKLVFKMIESSEVTGKGEGEGTPEDTDGEQQESETSSSPSPSGGTEVDTGDKQMTPDQDSVPTPSNGDELNPKIQKQVENLFKKEQDFLDGKTQKGKLTKNDNKIIEALGNSNSELTEVGGGNLGKTNVVVIPTLTKELIDSKAFHFLYNHNYYGKEIREKSINDGIRLGSILGKKLKVRGEEKDLIFTRQNSGKINKRLIAELGFDNGNVFSQVFKERYNKANLHISIDASGSMNGNKFEKSITSTIAMIKACEMAGNINVVVSFRWTQEDKPVVIICYDSSKDKISKIKTLWNALHVGGTTPESLCYEAIMKKWLSGVRGEDNYFINYSDGEPWFSNGEVYYHGDRAQEHTRKMVKMMKNNGIKITSYFISEGSYLRDSTKNNFNQMYGKDAVFIDPTNMMQVAKSMNSKFLEK